MVILITGASHTGKTLLAQKLMERYRYPVLSLDLLKMGLIHSGQTELTPEDDELLVPYLWGIAREMVKTTIENNQNLIVEGCYIPFDWQSDFEPAYLEQIEYICLVMTRRYLETHDDDVRRFANVIEQRLADSVDIDDLIADNEHILSECQKHNLPFCLIDEDYELGNLETAPLYGDDLSKAARLLSETVHAVNAHDYTSEQLDAWAPRNCRYHAEVAERLSGQLAIGAKECGVIVGFGSLNSSEGVIDLLFVHKDRQRQGIAQAILANLERTATAQGHRALTAFVSITAKPFFEAMGYTAEYENEVIRNGVSLTNYRMKKTL
jgi:Adenylate kinase and related kinases